MIKSLEELDKIFKRFYGKGDVKLDLDDINTTNDFLRFLKEEDRLRHIIETWNSENETLEDIIDVLRSRGFSWKLRSIRRLLLDEYKDLILPLVKFSEVLESRFSIVKSRIKPIIAGEMFMCIEDVVSPSNITLYQKGKVYISDIDECITGEDNNPANSWQTDQPEFYEHFKCCLETTTPRKLVEIKQGDKFKCIRNYNITLSLIAGNIYVSRHNDSLFNGENVEVNFKENTLLSEFEKYFVKI
jgi:hypothetical protein